MHWCLSVMVESMVGGALSDGGQRILHVFYVVFPYMLYALRHAALVIRLWLVVLAADGAVV